MSNKRNGEKLCVIPTTVGIELPHGAASAGQANRLVEENLNPVLSQCGSLPECRGCRTFQTGAIVDAAERIRRNRTQVGDLI